MVGRSGFGRVTFELNKYYLYSVINGHFPIDIKSFSKSLRTIVSKQQERNSFICSQNKF